MVTCMCLLTFVLAVNRQSTFEQRVCPAKTYRTTNSLVATKRAFRIDFNVRNYPNNFTDNTKVGSNRGYLRGENGTKKNSVCQDLGWWSENCRNRCSDYVETDVRYGRIAAKEDKWRPREVHPMQQLKGATVKQNRIRYCQKLMPDVLSSTRLTDET